MFGTGGGVGVAAVAGIARIRRRQRAGRARRHRVARAAEALHRSLVVRHPHVRWRGYVAGAATVVVEVDGQETAVPLHRLIREIAAFPDGVDHVVDRLVAELHAEALDDIAFHAFEDVAHAILPQVRTRAWFEARGGAFGEAALVRRPLGADLEACYVIDDERAMTFVCRRHLGMFGRTIEELHRLALSNLRRRVGTELHVPASDDVFEVATGDGYDAARLLLLDPLRAEGRLLAIPERDLLWVGPCATIASDTWRGAVVARHAQSARPISAEVYRLAGGALERVGA